MDPKQPTVTEEPDEVLLRLDSSFSARYMKRERRWENLLKEKEHALIKLQRDNSLLLDKVVRWKKFFENAMAKIKENDLLRAENASLAREVTRLQAEHSRLKDEIEAVRKWAAGDDT